MIKTTFQFYILIPQDVSCLNKIVENVAWNHFTSNIDTGTRDFQILHFKKDVIDF